MGFFLSTTQKFLTFDGGLACSKGRKILTWRWEDFTSLTIDSTDRWLSSMAGAQRLQLKLGLRNGDTVRIGPMVKGIAALRDEIRSWINPRLNAEALSALGRGETVRFGPLAVHEAQGIVFSGGQINWDELGRVVVQNGKLEIFSLRRPDSAAAVYATHRIPNLDVLAGLVKSYLEIKAPGRPRHP
jgi:hypothetical protein